MMVTCKLTLGYLDQHQHQASNIRVSSTCYRSVLTVYSHVSDPADSTDLLVDDGWTPKQLKILTALFKGTPKPSPTRPPRLPPPLPSKFRPVGLPKSRRLFAKPPACARSSPNTAFVPRDSKDKRDLALLAAHINGLPQDQPVSSLLDGCAPVLLSGSLSATIRELGRFGNPGRAAEVFLWQEQYSHLWPDDRTLSATIEVLAEAGLEKDAWSLLNSGAPNSAMPFDALARGYVRSGRLNGALRVKEAAESGGCLLDQGVYAQLILLASRLNRKKEVCVLAQELGKFPELRLKLEHCTMVMAACRKTGIHEAVQKLFQWWRSSGFKPNVIMYTIVMTSLSNEGKHREALAIYWDMEQNGCAPDLHAYKVLIRLCADIGDSLRALRLFARMKEANISPNPDVYRDLIKACCKDGRFGKAREFLEARKAMGVTTNMEEYLTD